MIHSLQMQLKIWVFAFRSYCHYPDEIFSVYWQHTAECQFVYVPLMHNIIRYCLLLTPPRAVLSRSKLNKASGTCYNYWWIPDELRFKGRRQGIFFAHAKTSFLTRSLKVSETKKNKFTFGVDTCHLDENKLLGCLLLIQPAGKWDEKMEGNNSTAFLKDDASPITAQDIVFATLYSLIVLPGVIGNGIVITIVRKTPSMHTTTNYLLLNLAVADLLTLLLCPGLYDYALTKAHLERLTGDLICKLFAGNAVVPITINVAVLTVCTIAVERYLALVKPFRSNLRISEDNVKYCIALLWFLALLSCIPDIQANTYDIESSKYPCKRPWSLDEYFLHKPFIIVSCVCFGIVSSLILFICYFEIIRGLYFTKKICSESSVTEAERRAKKQLARLLIWLTIIFSVCSLPFAIFFLFLTFADVTTAQNNYDTLHLIHRVVRFFLFSNSFFNPLLYALQSSNYRDGCKLLFSCRLKCCTLRETDYGLEVNYRCQTTKATALPHESSVHVISIHTNNKNT